MTAPDDPFRKSGEAYQPPGGGYGQPAGGYGGAPGGDHGSGYGGPPGGHSQGTNGLAIAALVLGILALLSSITVFGGIVLGLIAIVLGVIGLRKAKQGAGGGTMAGIGIGLGVVGLLVAIGIIVLGVSLFNSDAGQGLTQCLEQAAGDPNAEQECAVEFEESFSQ